MATKQKGGIGRDKNKGMYFRSLGWVANYGGLVASYPPPGVKLYTQPKFWLGREAQEAERRNLRLEQLWRCVVAEWEAKPPGQGWYFSQDINWGRRDRPSWPPDVLLAARALAKGEDSVKVEGGDSWTGGEYATYLAWLNSRFPVVRFLPQDATACAQSAAAVSEKAQLAHQVEEQLQSLGVAPPDPTQRLHHALDAYIADLEKVASLSAWRRVQWQQAKRLRDRHDDLPLSALDITRVEDMIAFWRNRPPVKLKGGKAGGRAAYNTCRNQIIQLRHFFKWLHKRPEYAWRRPEGYDDVKATPTRTADDLASKLRTLHVVTYTPEELAILYAAASPLMRLFILLGLNCGFAGAETGTLAPGEIFLRQLHPENGRYGIVSAAHDSWIRRLRPKTAVYGEWRLWPHTVQGLEWAMRRRGRIESAETAVIVTSTGQSYGRATKSGNKNSRVRNLWVSLIERTVQPAHPGFRFLPFKQLRKTGGEMVRRFGDGETQGVFLCHGQPVKTDQLADIYSSRPFFKVFETLDKIEKHLAPMWEACPDPFGVEAGREVRTA